MTIRISNVLVDGKTTDVLIEGNRIKKIGNCRGMAAEFEIDGTRKAAIPGLFNCHTHAAMTLFRGFADDLPLQEWLEQKIWPLESKLTEDDVYWGTKLACLEMIKTGTTFFSDMYWHAPGIVKGVEEAGLRAMLCSPDIDFTEDEKAKKQLAENDRFYQKYAGKNPAIQFALGPHSPYATSLHRLEWTAEFSKKHNVPVNIHVSETKQEVEDVTTRRGMRPVEFLDSLGLLNPRLFACHCLWLDDREIALLAKHKANVVHCPASNLKLTSGHSGFPYVKLVKAGIRPCLGTDGASSNNNLDLFESMKLASLLQKSINHDPSVLPAQEAFDMATINAARAFGIDAGMVLEGKLADLLLIDLQRPELVPNHNLISNLVYAANGSCVDTTICNGKILMQAGKVEGEEKIMEKAEAVAFAAVRR
jgi:5-methylthioadenosine/S-adenosylhomocysteine deaminase